MKTKALLIAASLVTALGLSNCTTTYDAMDARFNLLIQALLLRGSSVLAFLAMPWPTIMTITATTGVTATTGTTDITTDAYHH